MLKRRPRADNDNAPFFQISSIRYIPESDHVCPGSVGPGIFRKYQLNPSPRKQGAKSLKIGKGAAPDADPVMLLPYAYIASSSPTP